MLNNDYRDMLCALCAEKVEFLLVGAYAMAFQGHVRATMDMDLWVRPSPANAEAVMRALTRFGAPLQGLTTADLLKEDTVFQIGVAPRRIDLMTGASGLRFEDAFSRSDAAEIEGLAVRVLSVPDLIINKKTTGRMKDLADAEALESFLDA